MSEIRTMIPGAANRLPAAARALAAACLLLCSLLAGEFALRAIASVWPRADYVLALAESPDAAPRLLPDDSLGWRLNPGFPGHDSNGYRNPGVPSSADIVTLGDSQTYGTGVPDGRAWPRVLEASLSSSVYDMSCPSYGPAHSLLLLDDALRLRPRTVLVTLYAGNDLYDSFQLTYVRGILPRLKSRDSGRERSIRRAQETEPLTRKVDRLVEASREDPGPGLPVRRFFATRSRLYALAKRSFILGRGAVRALSKDPPLPAGLERWGGAGPMKSVLTPAYRLLALDMDDPRVAEGLDVSLAALLEMHQKVRRAGSRLVVVFVPTKESVMAPSHRSPSATFRSLAANEARVRSTAEERLRRGGVEYVDTLPVLRAMLSKGVMPYPPSSDGHPNEAGHAALAQAVAGYLSTETPRPRR